MKLCLIVAMSDNRVIGRDGQLPWKAFGDLKRVKELTMGYPIIMGRKTHESIGRILPGRPNIVLSRRHNYAVPGALVFHGLDEALNQLQSSYDKAFVFGGGEIYRQALPRVDRIYLTVVHQHMEGDTVFPEIPEDTFVEIEREDHNRQVPFSWVTLERK